MQSGQTEMHEYMLRQLVPFHVMARDNGDQFLGYLIGMVIAHCDAVMIKEREGSKGLSQRKAPRLG